MLEPFDLSHLNGLALYLDLVPYDVGRPVLYDAAKLYGSDRYDARVYEHFLQTGKLATTPKELLARSLHDYCIRKALEDFMDGSDEHRCVGVMGGHSLRRGDAQYLQIVRLSKRLTETGFLMISGGGPGAMEATHLGAWMAGRTDHEVEAALEILTAFPTFDDEGWLSSALEVCKRFPQRSDFTSLGVPTWLYGHEPSTPFATHIAKFFDNSIREDFILTAAGGGIIFTPGSAGTLQEVFQEAVQDHYLSFGYSSPMIFLGTHFWRETVPVYTLLETMMMQGTYKNLLLTLTDSEEEVCQVLMQQNKSFF